MMEYEENPYQQARRLQRERFEARTARADKPKKNAFHPIDGSSAMSYFNKRDSIKEKLKR